MGQSLGKWYSQGPHFVGFRVYDRQTNSIFSLNPGSEFGPCGSLYDLTQSSTDSLTIDSVEVLSIGCLTTDTGFDLHHHVWEHSTDRLSTNTDFNINCSISEKSLHGLSANTEFDLNRSISQNSIDGLSANTEFGLNCSIHEDGTDGLSVNTDFSLNCNIQDYSSDDDNVSTMDAFMANYDAFMANYDVFSFDSPPSTSTWTATTATYPTTKTENKSQPFNQKMLQQHLKALIESTCESWTYGIFWQSSIDFFGSYFLSWGDGYYKGEDKMKETTMPSSIVEQEHRKKVVRKLKSLIVGIPISMNDDVSEEITDTEWFFSVSMTQSFVNGDELPGQAFFTSTPVWIAGNNELSNFSCERVRQARLFGLQTLACIPWANGVVELGSTELIFQSTNLMNKVSNLEIRS